MSLGNTAHYIHWRLKGPEKSCIEGTGVSQTYLQILLSSTAVNNLRDLGAPWNTGWEDSLAVVTLG